jgi:hypothetical protein
VQLSTLIHKLHIDPCAALCPQLLSNTVLKRKENIPANLLGVIFAEYATRVAACPLPEQIIRGLRLAGSLWDMTHAYLLKSNTRAER